MDEKSPPPVTGQEPNEAAVLRDLAIRLLAKQYPAVPGSMPLQLLVGQLPPNLPLELPIPEGIRVLGSLIYGEPTVVIDTELSPEDVGAFYEARLGTAGWSLDSPSGRHGGFVHSDAGERWSANFIRSEQDPWLTISAVLEPDSRTTIQLNPHTAPRGGPMRSPYRGRRRHGPGSIYEVLPAIRPPQKARQFPEGGGGGPDRVHATARLETDLELAAVQQHYLGQLEQADWERRDAGESGPIGWSTWTFHDDEGQPWRALLIIVKPPEVLGRYALQLSAELAGGETPGGSRGWTATASSIDGSAFASSTGGTAVS